MATIANLAAKIGADTNGFDKGITRVLSGMSATRTKAEQFGAGISKGFSALKLIGIAAAGFLAVQLASSKVTNALSDLHIARQAGVDVAALKTLQQAMRDVGVPTEDAGKALLGLSKTLASVEAGNTAATDALRRLGLDADKLSRMNSADAFRELAAAFSKIQDPAKRAALAVQLFGDDAGSVLPVLVQGAEGLDRAKKRLEAFGGAFTSIDITNLETSKILFDNLTTALSNVGLKIAVELLPFVHALMEMLSDAADSGFSVTDAIKGVVYAVVIIGAAAKDIGNMVKMVFNIFVGSLQSLAIEALKIIEDINNLTARLPGLAGRVGASNAQIARNMREQIERERGTTKRDFDEMQKVDMWDSVKKADAWFDKLLEKTQKAGDDANKLRGAFGAVAAAFKFADLFKQGSAVTNEVSSPLEKFSTKVRELNLQLAKGAISWTTYSRATAAAVGELEKAHELQTLSLAQGLRANTSEAASAINRAKLQEDMRLRESPQARTNRILEESKAIEAKQLEQATRTADAVRNQKVVRF